MYSNYHAKPKYFFYVMILYIYGFPLDPVLALYEQKAAFCGKLTKFVSKCFPIAAGFPNQEN